MTADALFKVIMHADKIKSPDDIRKLLPPSVLHKSLTEIASEISLQDLLMMMDKLDEMNRLR